MKKQRDLFIDGVIKHSGLTRKKGEELFDLIAPFAGYGFNKAHAVCYGLIAYQTAYLKARKIIERKVDTNGNIFYAMIRDFDPKGKKDLTGGLVVSYFETDTNEELIGEEELLTLPRHRSQVKQPFVSDLEDKNMDWQKLRGVTASLNKTPEFITKEKFETLEHKLT